MLQVAVLLSNVVPVPAITPATPCNANRFLHTHPKKRRKKAKGRLKTQVLTFFRADGQFIGAESLPIVPACADTRIKCALAVVSCVREVRYRFR